LKRAHGPNRKRCGSSNPAEIGTQIEAAHRGFERRTGAPAKANRRFVAREFRCTNLLSDNASNLSPRKRNSRVLQITLSFASWPMTTAIRNIASKARRRFRNALLKRVG